MNLRTRARRAVAGTATGGLVAAGGLAMVVASGVGSPATAAPANLQLTYTCDYPLIGGYPLEVDMTVALPDQTVVGEPTGSFDVEAVATVSAETVQAISFLPIATIEGTADAEATVIAPDFTLPLTVPDLEVPQTEVPDSGAFDVVASGGTPSIEFTAPGTGQIEVGDLLLNLLFRDGNGDVYTALPGANEDGTYDVPCTVNEGQETLLAEFPIVDGNTAPVADDVTAETGFGTAVDVTLAGSDADGDELTYTVGEAGNGTVEVDGDVATYTPAEGFEGEDSFTYEVSDGQATDEGTVTVTVEGEDVPEEFNAFLQGNAHIETLNGDVPLGGTVQAEVASDGELTADINLFTTVGEFNVGGSVPMEAIIGFEQVGAADGSITDGSATINAQFDVKMPLVVAFGFPIAGGADCQTAEPVSLSLESGDSLLSLGGEFELPRLTIEDCGWLGHVVSDAMEGGGNSVAVDLLPVN